MENAAAGNASLVSGISSLTQQEEELEREKEKIMAQLSEQMGKKMRKGASKQKRQRVADVAPALPDGFDPLGDQPAQIDQVEEVTRVKKGKALAMFDDRFRDMYNLKDGRMGGEVIEL